MPHSSVQLSSFESPALPSRVEPTPLPTLSTQQSATFPTFPASTAPAQPASELTLEMLEHLARRHHPALAQAAALIDATRGREIQARLYPNPTIGYEGSDIGEDGAEGKHGVVLSQEIVRGGKLRLAGAVATYEREQQELRANAQLIRVINSVRSLFYETLAAQRTASLTAELVRLAEQGKQIAEERLRAGEGTLPERLQAEIESDQVRILEATAMNSYHAAWQRLATLVGQADLPPQPLADQLEAGSWQRDYKTVLDRLLRDSPEVQLAERGVRRAEAALAHSRAERVPNVTVEAGTQYDFAGERQVASVGVSWPFPHSNRNQGNIRAARAELAAAHHELARVKLELTERLAAAFAKYRTALEQVQRYGKRLSDDEIRQILEARDAELQQKLATHRQIIPRAQLVLALTTEGWRRGEFGYVQVLTTQRTFVEASLAHIRALADLQQSIVAIDGLLLADGSAQQSAAVSPPHP